MRYFPIPDAPSYQIDPLAKTEQGQVVLNPEMKGITHYFQSVNANNAGLPIISVASNSNNRGVLTNNRDGHIELVKLTYTSTGDFLILFKDEGAGRQLQNRPVHIRTIGGTGQMPGILPSNIVLDPSRSLYVEVTDISGAPNTIWMHLSGPKYYYMGALTNKRIVMQESTYRKKTNCYFYTTNQDIVVATGASVFGKVNISEEHDFLWLKLTAYAKDANGDPVNFIFKMTEESSGRALSNSWMHSANCTGIGTMPYILPQKMLLPRSSSFLIEFQAIEGVDPTTIYFTMQGKVLNYPSDLMTRSLKE